ncbi:UNVERIFIED_CONTAM: hypothetical protein FKN15_067141 [Acipenser sinensis]
MLVFLVQPALMQMISAEAPVLFAKAAQIFITELTLRAWIHTEDNKRRTLQRNDIAMAITKFDQFDFLIDIVPRDELKPPKRQTLPSPVRYEYRSTSDSVELISPPQWKMLCCRDCKHPTLSAVCLGAGRGMFTLSSTDWSAVHQRLESKISYLLVPQETGYMLWDGQQLQQEVVLIVSDVFKKNGQQLYQIQQVTMPAGQELSQPMFIQSTSQAADGQATQVLQGAGVQQYQQVQVAQPQTTASSMTMRSRRTNPCACLFQSQPVTMQVGEGQQLQIVQAGQGQQAQAATGQTMQVMQQIITNTGEIQQIPVQLNTGQLQYIRLAQPVSGTQVVQGQIQTLATNAQQQLYQIQQVTMPAGQELSQPMFIQSTSQAADGQATQVTTD